MRCILRPVAVIALLALAACAPEPPVYAGESAASADDSAQTVPAVAGANSGTAANPAGEVRIEPAPPPPASLHEFVSRPDRAATRLRRADFARLFPREARVGTDPTASFEFADLDGDGRDEAYVAIGDGWWGKRHRLLAFDPDADEWQLAAEREVATPTRGTPVVGVLPGADRPRLQVRYRSGWGTGIGTTSLSVHERHAGRLVEVLSVQVELEEIHHGVGPTLEAMHDPLAFTRDETGGGVFASTTARLSLWTGRFGDLPERIDCEFPMRWRQLAAGSPFVLVDPTHPLLQLARASDYHWHRAACLWIDRHGEAALALAAGLDGHQASILRNICNLAAQPGASASQGSLADRLRALLPTAPR